MSAEVTVDEARRVTAEIRALAEGVPAAVYEVPLRAGGSGRRNGDHWYVSHDHQVVASIASNDGENEDERGPYARLFAATPKLLQAVLATLDAHPDENGQCGALCQDTADYKYPCGVVQDVVRAWTA